MHITLSMHEAISILRTNLGQRLGETVTVTVSIDNDQIQPSQFMLFVDRIRSRCEGSGGFINAIKYFRGVTGEGLVESKAIVDEIRAGEPSPATVAKIVLVNPDKI